LETHTPRFDQAGKKITGVDKVFNTRVFASNVWGLEWYNSDISHKGFFPQYFKHVGDKRVAISAADVPAETQLLAKEFKLTGRGGVSPAPHRLPAPGAIPARRGGRSRPLSPTDLWSPIPGIVLSISRLSSNISGVRIIPIVLDYCASCIWHKRRVAASSAAWGWLAAPYVKRNI